MTLESNLSRLATFVAGLALGLTCAANPARSPEPDPSPIAAPVPMAQPVAQQVAQDATQDAAPRGLKAAAEGMQERRKLAWGLFDKHLYGANGRTGMTENVRARILELAELGDPESRLFDDQMFFLGFMRLFQEMGAVIPGRNEGIQTTGRVEILTESFEGDAWLLDAPMVRRTRGLAVEGIPPEGLSIPKGRFLRYIDKNGLHAADTDPETLHEGYVILLGMGDQAALIYPNLNRPDAPWVAWLPGRTVAPDWARPVIPKSAFHGR